MPIPKEAWLLAWTCLLGQVASVIEGGRQDDNMLIPSMLLGAAVVAFFSYGVLRGRMVRTVIVGVILGLGLLAYVVGAVDDPSTGGLLDLAITAGSFWFFVAFVRTPYFAWQRSRPTEPGPSLAGLVAIAVVVGALGGVVGATDDGFHAEMTL